MKLSREQARLTTLAAQGLGTPGSALVPTVERTGFVRTLGGADGYVALHQRVAGLRTADVHAALGSGAVRVTPAVRGCMYLVAGRDAPHALRLAGQLLAAPRAREFEKAGIRPGELDALVDEMVKVLDRSGPLTTDELRRALPAEAVRSLGDAGKKVGITSTLPPALRVAELANRIERTPEEQRLDTERYRWRALPAAAPAATEEPAALLARVAEIFFRAAGVSTVKAFAEWAGVPQRDAATALERVDLVAVEVAGEKQPRRALRAALELDRDAARAAVAFLPFEDNVFATQGGPAMLVDDAHLGIEVPTWGSGGRPSTLGEAKHLGQRSVVAEGRLVGFWEFDPDARKVVHACFDDVAAATKKKLAAAAAALGTFLADDVGHGRAHALDSDDELRKRLAWVKHDARQTVRTRRSK